MDLNLLQRETALAPDLVRNRWRYLTTLPAVQRGFLEPLALAGAWKVPVAEVLDFLWACVVAGGLEVLWQRVSPDSGWVVDEAGKPDELSPVALTDPFSNTPVLPDLGQGCRVVFRLGPDASAGTWSAYARSRQTGGAEPRPSPTWSKTLQPWEVGRLDIEVLEDEVYHLACLENRSHLSLTVDSAKVIGGRSFIGKMKQYRAQKFLLSLQKRVIDLKVLPTGFETEQTLIAPGQLVYWLENKTAAPVTLQVWKDALPPPLPPQAFFDARASLGLPSFRRYWSQLELAADFHRPVNGLVHLFADFQGSGAVFSEGDERSYHELTQAFGRITARVEAHGGFVHRRHPLQVSAAFVSVEAALEATRELWVENSSLGALVPTLSVSAGPVLLVNEDGRASFFGANLYVGEVLQRGANPGELWVSLGVLSSDGVAEWLKKGGLVAQPEMRRTGSDDQRVLAYRISPSSSA